MYWNVGEDLVFLKIKLKLKKNKNLNRYNS